MGIFQRYKSLTLMYVGYGGNHNSTTRFREYFGQGMDTKDDVTRPVIKEYRWKITSLYNWLFRDLMV